MRAVVAALSPGVGAEDEDVLDRRPRRRALGPLNPTPADSRRLRDEEPALALAVSAGRSGSSGLMATTAGVYARDKALEAERARAG